VSSFGPPRGANGQLSLLARIRIETLRDRLDETVLIFLSLFKEHRGDLALRRPRRTGIHYLCEPPERVTQYSNQQLGREDLTRRPIHDQELAGGVIGVEHAVRPTGFAYRRNGASSTLLLTISEALTGVREPT